jgi:two-component system phosphate regulon response regulator PhoB
MSNIDPVGDTAIDNPGIDQPTVSDDAILRFMDIELDWRGHRVRRGRRLLQLSTLDVRLLRFLMLSPGEVFTRDEILRRVWPQGVYVCDRTVDVHMAALRKALHDPHLPDPVRTVRGRGYSLDCIEWANHVEAVGAEVPG